MPRYAEIDNKGFVKQVIVAPNMRFIRENYRGRWIRVDKRVGPGHQYNKKNKTFRHFHSDRSWAYNSNTKEYDPPKPKPRGDYNWDEDTQEWVK